MFAFNLMFWVSLRWEDALLFRKERAVRGSYALPVVPELQETLCVRALLQQVREYLREIRPNCRIRPEGAQTASASSLPVYSGMATSEQMNTVSRCVASAGGQEE